jgi:hypothetical protein
MSIIESGFTAPANLVRPAGSQYRYKGVTYTQTAIPSGSSWEEQPPVDVKAGETIKTGKKINGKDVYQLYLEGTGFTNPGSYALIPTGLSMAAVRIINAYGWCEYTEGQTAEFYSNYFDGSGNFRSFWTGALNKPWRVTIEYVKV